FFALSQFCFGLTPMIEHAKSLFVRGIFRLKTVESGRGRRDETKFFDARNRAETELPYAGTCHPHFSGLGPQGTGKQPTCDEISPQDRGSVMLQNCKRAIELRNPRMEWRVKTRSRSLRHTKGARRRRSSNSKAGGYFSSAIASIFSRHA